MLPSLEGGISLMTGRPLVASSFFNHFFCCFLVRRLLRQLEKEFIVSVILIKKSQATMGYLIRGEHTISKRSIRFATEEFVVTLCVSCAARYSGFFVKLVVAGI